MRTSHPIRTDHREPARPGGALGAVLDLAGPAATDPALAGAKAANLARAAAAGLPVLPGFVLATAGPPDPAAVRQAWQRLSDGGARPLVVRSSSTVEDAGTSSMAGQFRSVLGVVGWPAFEDAVRAVLESAVRRAEPGAPPAPMAVLVQPELAPVCAGVLFGVDPVTGNRHRLTVEAVHGSPDALVSGVVTAARYLMTRRGHLLEASERGMLGPWRRRRLALLARRAARVFGGPQDVEWAFDAGGRLWLLQSRPVTATGHQDHVTGPVLGPGPVSETFPLPLRPLEIELWVAPLRRGIVEALRLTGAVSRRRLRASPVVTTVGGRVAVDLELLGATPARPSLARALDPRRPARRLVAAWRVGRLRAALPGVVAETLVTVDRDLTSLPAFAELSDDQLVLLLRRLPEELVPIHVREVLAGMLLHAEEGGRTAASVALADVAAGRAAGRADADIVARRPVVLALTPPRVGAPRALPGVADAPAAGGGLADLDGREALRLRARWVQEAAARAATELGRRLVAAGRLPDAERIAHLTMDEVAALGAGASAPAPAPDDIAARAAVAAGPPLPAAFRLAAGGDVVAVVTHGGPGGGRAAGGGRGVGPVRHEVDRHGAAPGAVLVVETLSPELAGSLPGLAGLVSETGSTLSHLAILARELGVPTVVGVDRARQRFPAGAVVVVDGGTGEVSLVPESEGAIP